jgi:type I restriction enzyme, S subunit
MTDRPNLPNLPGSLKLPGRSLKPGWTMVKFGDVVRLNTDRISDPAAAGIERYVGLEHIEPEDLRIRRWGFVANGTTFTNYFKPGQTLFGKRRAYQRKVAVADFAGVCSGDIYVFEPKDACLLPELLPFICQTERFYEYAIGTSAGSLSPRTNSTQLAQYEFALPPLAKQRRMAEVLWASFVTVEALREAVPQLANCEKAFLNETINRWQESVCWVELSNVLQGSPDSGCSAPPRDNPTGHWVLALNALSEMGYQPGELKPVDKTNEMISALLRRGDLLISRSNTRERVGFVGIYNGESEGTVSFPDTMMRLVLKENVISNKFLELVLQSNLLRRQIIAIAAGTSASMKKINRKNLLQIKIPLPNLSEQTKVIEMRQQFRQDIASMESRLLQGRNLYKRLLLHLLAS